MRRQHLRAGLRRARDEAALPQEQVAENLDWSLSRTIRIESGAANISDTRPKAVLALYGIAIDRLDDLAQLTKAARERTWRSGYLKVLPPHLRPDRLRVRGPHRVSGASPRRSPRSPPGRGRRCTRCRPCP
ncbi:helix-turn-helix transcriptional regulator [Actinomadura sp. NPDC049382]|uniref:helix-turn-helix domain-containing protein n=1 Tax=Actinomadura sp. NPDC049382 TaxID=3158220 RepID=UPI0034368D63